MLRYTQRSATWESVTSLIIERGVHIDIIGRNSHYPQLMAPGFQPFCQVVRAAYQRGSRACGPCIEKSPVPNHPICLYFLDQRCLGLERSLDLGSRRIHRRRVAQCRHRLWRIEVHHRESKHFVYFCHTGLILFMHSSSKRLLGRPALAPLSSVLGSSLAAKTAAGRPLTGSLISSLVLYLLVAFLMRAGCVEPRLLQHHHDLSSLMHCSFHR